MMKAAQVAEELKKHERTQALLLRIRSGEDLDRLISDLHPDRSSDGYVTLDSQDYPEVAEICERKKAKKAKAAAAAQDRRKAIDLAAPAVEIRETHLESSGNWTFLCPGSMISEAWAKHITGTNSQAGGYGLEGEWLKIGTSCTLAAGEIILTGTFVLLHDSTMN